MRIQAYTVFEFGLTVTVETARAEPIASTKFTAASIHHDYASAVGGLLVEHKHLSTQEALQYPATKRLSTYLPTHNGEPLFLIAELIPTGTPRDFDDAWQLEITRLRYNGTMHLLPAAFLADESIREGKARAMEYAVYSLFKANNLPGVFTPGDMTIRTGTGTEIDIACEIGAASGRRGVDVAGP